ncbi:hypothetical protein EPUS_08512 [Endocarpon pusillum Z07020]|uniref:Vacuolar membrane PQ loop repeat protein n=1 Tax=Endocarpon pusillum (strain Z07020 / HMAS-L-300199) TaxID=1263415 RepID=U1G8R3_ENDPU|nr:uncharacterized protein EPUS_08512 [Endocarpon pusillum Z07020]ERF68076.1 hypothetical protein EPUS_08512 [Endocarpon pusillum Z07020]
MAAIPLTGHEALSGILGSISIACWIFLLIPQLLTNYRNTSASALSLPFLLIWFLGDVCNLAGAAWAGLVPTVIAIAVYFCFLDAILVLQWGYYHWIYRAGGVGEGVQGKTDAGAAAAAVADGKGNGHGNGRVGEGVDMLGEEEPLLARQRSGSITIPGSQRPSRKRRTSSSATAGSATRRRSSQASNLLLDRILEEDNRGTATKTWMKNLISILGVIVVGTAGWAIAWGSGAWTPTPVDSGSGGAGTGATGPFGAQILGYGSAVAYLGARIPQIVKNARDRSCEGLSLLFFILSLSGNLTYGAGIMAHSLRRDYLLMNTPWLVGSLGTMLEDAIIFTQFHIYAKNSDGAEEAVV